MSVLAPSPELKSSVRAAFSAPLENLSNAVYVAFESFSEHRPKSKKAVYSIFAGDFDGKLASWSAGKSRSIQTQINFTEILIRIFRGTERKAVRDQNRYDPIVRKIRSDERYARISDLVAELERYLATLHQQRDFSSDFTAEGSLSEAMAALSAPMDAPDSTRNGGQSTRNALTPLGRFPGHTKSIAALVRSARESVVAHTDTADYASFRDFEAHRELVEALTDRARNGIPVEFLIYSDHLPMSLANRFKVPGERSHPEFRLCVREFLTALKKWTNLAETAEYKNVEACLSEGADWANENGAIRTLLQLQLKLDEVVLLELRQSGADVRGSDKGADLDQINTEKYRVGPTQFYWIVDRSKAVIVKPALGTDAPAISIENREYVYAELTNFYSIFDLFR